MVFHTLIEGSAFSSIILSTIPDATIAVEDLIKWKIVLPEPEIFALTI